MKLTNKKMKLAGVMALALIGASPVALSTAASAAPMQPVAMQQKHDDRGPQFGQNDRDGRDGRGGAVNIKVADNNVSFRFGYDDHRYGDRFHKPPPKFEHIARPHFAKHFHQGHWQFQYGHWVWVKGFWTR